MHRRARCAAPRAVRPPSIQPVLLRRRGRHGGRRRTACCWRARSTRTRIGFEAVWTPERHFHAFGGAYPNPRSSARRRRGRPDRIAIRAGSVVLPLHSPARVAEEWAVVDNLSGGRVGISFAPGWQPNDFVLNPTRYHTAPRGASRTDRRGARAVARARRSTCIGPDGQRSRPHAAPAGPAGVARVADLGGNDARRSRARARRAEPAHAPARAIDRPARRQHRRVSRGVGGCGTSRRGSRHA